MSRTLATSPMVTPWVGFTRMAEIVCGSVGMFCVEKARTLLVFTIEPMDWVDGGVLDRRGDVLRPSNYRSEVCSD